MSVHSTTAGSYVNTIPAGALVTDIGTNASPASATLTVTALPVAPTLSKAFSPSSVTAGSPSHLTLTLGNANTSAATLLAGLVDTLPSGLVVATPANASTTCPNGTVGATSGGTTITLNTPAEIPANGSCTVGVDVVSDDAGTYVNTIAAGALHTTLGDNAAPASATLIACNGADLVGPAPSRDYGSMFDDLWKEFDLHYSYFALKPVSWDSLGAHYRPLAVAAPNDVAFGSVLGQMVSQLEDLHVAHSLEQVASFHALDDPHRNVLVLFKLHPLRNGARRDPSTQDLQQVLPDDRIQIPVE